MNNQIIVFLSLCLIVFNACKSSPSSIFNENDYTLKTYKASLVQYQAGKRANEIKSQTEVLYKDRFYSYSEFLNKNKLNEIKTVKIISDSVDIAKFNRDIKLLIVME